MNHLTANEVLQVVDGTVMNGERTRILVHLETCPRCRREVEFSKKMERAVRSAPLSKPSREFTSRVMGKIAPQTKKSIGALLIDNLANVLAMALVLTIVWYAVSVKSESGPAKGPTVVSNALSVYSEYYSKVREFLAADRVKAIQRPVSDQSSETNKIVMFTLISIVILVAVDKIVLRRVIRLYH